MPSLPKSAESVSYTVERDALWSRTEKVIARKAFDDALRRELEGLLRDAKNQVASMTQSSELWDFELYLTRRRREIDRKYDYRYSVLYFVLANLLRDGLISEEDLKGLSTDKLNRIRHIAGI